MTTETEITPELQHRVADALGLPRAWKTETSHGANPPGSAIWHFEDFTTGDGMLRLLGAMRARGWHFLIQDDEDTWIVSLGSVGGLDGTGYASAPTLPAAVPSPSHVPLL